MPQTSSARLWAVLTHFSALALYLGIPFANVLAPFMVWLLKRRDWPENDAAVKEVLNFQITACAAMIAAGIVAMLLSGATGGLFWPVGGVLVGLVLVAHATLTIWGTVEVERNGWYSYPWTFRIWR